MNLLQLPGARGRQIENQGVVLRGIEAGTGPRVILVHGFPGLGLHWFLQAQALIQAGFSVLVPDLRGYGYSDKPDDVAAYAMDKLVEDMTLWLTLDGARGAVLVGHDWGGVIAWRTAMARPDILSRLVIVNAPHPKLFMKALRMPMQWFKSAYALAFAVPKLPERVLPQLVSQLLRRGARPGAFADPVVEMTVQSFRDPMQQNGALAYYRAMVNPTLRKLGPPLAKVTTPTLVLWGERDAVLGLDLVKGLDREVEKLTVTTIPHAGHWPQNDQPIEFNRALLTWLKG